MAIVPAGTANLFASNLGIPKHIDAAVEVGLNGARRKLDVGRLNGEKFAVMAGVGFDARVIRDATPEMKHALGRSAYVWAGAKNLRAKPFDAKVVVDGEEWYEGPASLVLFGNVGNAFAGVKAFADAQPDDGLLEIGVGSAHGAFQWGRTLARSATGGIQKSRFVHMTKGRKAEVKLSRKVLVRARRWRPREEEDVSRRCPAERRDGVRPDAQGGVIEYAPGRQSSVRLLDRELP